MSSAAQSMITLARRSQQWLRSRPRLVDVLVAGLMALLALADLSSDVAADGTRDPDAVAVLLILIGATALVWRRNMPIAIMVFVIVISCVFYARDYGSFMAPVGLASLYAVTTHERDRRTAWIALGVGFAVLFSVASFTLLDGVDGYRWSNGFSMILSIGATVLAGAVIRNKEEIFADTKKRAEQAEADRQAEAERAVIQERLRIAREMHDVVAHGMSLITVQAAAAQEIAHTRPDEAVRLMHSVETTGRDALAEMRRMLGVLRNNDLSAAGAPRGTLAPQPSLADIDTTIANCIQAGTPTELVIRGDRRALPAGIELVAFRIVQEALTNVVKHGGDDATATVELRYETDTLHIRISNTGRGVLSQPTPKGGGHGLIGMHERIEIYNGQFAAGPRPGGGYQVDASLPVNAASERPAVVSAEPKSAAPT